MTQASQENGRALFGLPRLFGTPLRWLSAAVLLLLGTPSCDSPMGMPDAGVVDLAMSIDGASCTMCGGACVDLQSDAKNCGACGVSCSPAEMCMAGSCRGDAADLSSRGDLSAAPDLSAAADLSVARDLGALPDLSALVDLASADGSMMSPHHLCGATPPAGAKLAPPPPVYAGTCPMLVPGKNTIITSGGPRTFLLAVPTALDPMEKLPVVFLWHWLGGSADEFLRKGEVQAAVNSQRFLAILPEAKSDMLFKWPFDLGVTAMRQEQEYKFFDDMLACAAAQFRINNNCVSTAGVSAGAMFTDQLAAARSKYLASAMSLSGGVGGVAKPWGKPMRKLPMMVLWGGMKDNCLGLVNFEVASKNLEAELTRDKHFFLECVHNCGHAEPPLDAPAMMSKYASLWNFVFDHPYWLTDGDSPYLRTGVPTDFPSWCAIGAGKSVPRTGICPSKPGC